MNFKFRNILVSAMLIIGLCVAWAFSTAVTDEDIKGKVHGMITDAHARVHQGEMYSASTRTISLADDGYYRVLIDITTNTFTNNEFHLFMAYATGGDSVIELFEGTTCSSSGTLMTSYNFNRDVADSPQSLIYINPAIITTTGTCIYTQLIPGGTGGNAGGGTNSKNVEWVLEGNSYMIVIQNISGGAKPVGVEIDFYEVE